MTEEDDVIKSFTFIQMISFFPSFRVQRPDQKVLYYLFVFFFFFKSELFISCDDAISWTCISASLSLFLSLRFFVIGVSLEGGRVFPT